MPEAQWLYINVVIFALQTGLRTDAGNTIRRERINQSDARLFNATIIVIARAENFIAGGRGELSTVMMMIAGVMGRGLMVGASHERRLLGRYF